MRPSIGFTLLVLTSLARADEPVKLADKLEEVEVNGNWGPKVGPDGKTETAIQAVIPPRIHQIVMNDVRAWYGKEFPEAAREKLLSHVEAKIQGRGPSAWFQRERTKEGLIKISKPQVSTKYELMGGEDLGFEVGVWQPPSKRQAVAVKDGFQWKVTWMMQVGSGKVRRRYRTEVDLTGIVDHPSGGILYRATWRGPYLEDAINMSEVPLIAKRSRKK